MKRLMVVALVVVATGTAGVLTLRPTDDNNAVASTPTKTATVDTRTITSKETFDGTLRYEGSRAISVPSKGVVTRTRSVGDVIERGGAIVWIDNQPVTLLYGDLPQWRTLSKGMEDGPDVRQLEQSLVDLGYAKGLNLTVDNEFTDVTETAVKRMQAALGIAEDGIFDLGEIVFLGGPGRVVAVTSDAGEVVGQSVVEMSSTKRVVEVSLDPSDRDQVATGQSVKVELPDGETVNGTVRSVATTVDVSQGDGGGETESVEVVIDLADGIDVAFDQAPVDVIATSELAKDVLTVPVNALLAMTGGGYALEKVTAAGTELVPVELGAFGNGHVEIKGNVSRGDKVAVAS